MELEINVAQFAERAVGANFRGADRAFENAGDFGEREFLETREQQHFAVIAVEPRQRGVEQRVVVAGGGAVAGVRRIVGVRVQLDRIDRVRRGVGFAEMVGGAAAREVIHPRGEAAVVAIRVAVFEHPLKHRLRDVLGRRAIAGEFHQKSEERSVVALEEFAERIEFAVADGEHERVIGALFGSGVHRGRLPAFKHGRGRMNTDFFEGGNHGGRRTWLMLP